MPSNSTVEPPKNRNLINKLALSVRDGIASIYTRSFYNRPTNLADIRDIKDRLNTSINNIVSNNMDMIGEPNISRLLSRANQELKDDPKFNKAIEDFFSDSISMDALLQTYMENKYLIDLDQEIDTICKYMPRLLEALDCKKDNVLSADHFSKDFIFMSNSTSIQDSTFSERIKALKDKYNLLEQTETWYMNASKYGEQFVYVVPFNKAIGRLLDSKNTDITIARVTESSYSILYEGGSIITPTYKESKTVSQDQFAINVEYDNSGLLTEVVEANYKAYKLKYQNDAKSVSEQFICDLNETSKDKEESHKPGTPITNQSSTEKTSKSRLAKAHNLINPEELDLSFGDNNISQDGLINPSSGAYNKDKKRSELELNIPGCIIKSLRREMVKPIYIEDICIGYLYIEVKDPNDIKISNNLFDFTSASLNTDVGKRQLKATDEIIDKKLRDISSQIVSMIDTKFINTNVNFAKEIYMLLKHNDYTSNPGKRIKVSFLPAEDVIHIKFREDPDTHRGISDLINAIFPAKIYCAMYLVNSIANMTRGYDRRVYYVKQTVDTNIAKNLLNTINQLKKSNFNIRQIENINNIIGISGSLNDYLIPTMGGDPPIQFEIMPGQRIDPPTEMMQQLEEMAINSTDIPIELLQARQSIDYAVHYTMTNTKFLRKIYNRQSTYARFLSIIMTKVYNYEYQSSERLIVTLPPPMFLNITNTNQIIQNTLEFSNNIIDMDDETNEELKSLYASKVKKYYLGSYLELDVLDKLKIEAEQEIQIKKAQEQ